MFRIPSKENKNIEFKEKLRADYHLREERKQQLAAQMKHKLEIGKGKAIYLIGVSDEGKAIGLNEIEFEETLNVLKIIARENNALIEKVEKFQENGKYIGKILITELPKKVKKHLTISVAGHVNHGKSTLIACLITGKKDEGKHWLYLDTLPHEIKRNLSADIHYALLGFTNSKILTLKNPLDRKERKKIVEKADKIISFVDLVGHEPWIRTTIRGLVGQNIDYGILVVAADDGVTHITKEHLGIMLAMELPVIICITKIDKVSEERIEEVLDQIDRMLKNVGKIPLTVKEKNDVDTIIDKLNVVVPIFKTSARTLEGYDLLYYFLNSLKEREKNLNKPFLMYIDKVYNIEGVGCVVSGSIKQGSLSAGKTLLLGPDEKGEFKEVKAKSIEMHYTRIDKAEAGLIVGIALKRVKYEEVKRGMILCEKELEPKAIRRFKAEILVLTHPTKISVGYEPVLHCNTIVSTVKIMKMNKKYLKAGDSDVVEMKFKYKPFFLQVNDKFVFREGKTKGIGSVIEILE